MFNPFRLRKTLNLASHSLGRGTCWAIIWKVAISPVSSGYELKRKSPAQFFLKNGHRYLSSGNGLGLWIPTEQRYLSAALNKASEGQGLPMSLAFSTDKLWKEAC